MYWRIGSLSRPLTETLDHWISACQADGSCRGKSFGLVRRSLDEERRLVIQSQRVRCALVGRSIDGRPHSRTPTSRRLWSGRVRRRRYRCSVRTRGSAVRRVLSTGVIGGGLIAQAVHLPNLTALSDRFSVAGIADPSRKVGETLAVQYAPARSYLDWRNMLEQEALDAVVVCSPHATHAEIVLDALDRGLHVFVEKPLCIHVEDGDEIFARATARSRVVQVGYMKRFSVAYEGFLAALPDDVDGLRLVDVVTYDPWMAREPFVPRGRMVQADDVPDAVLEAAAASEREQVERAVGNADAETVRAFSHTFVGCLVHDVNLVHGALETMGVDRPAEAVSGASWADGTAATATLRLPNGARLHCSWMLLDGLMTFRERVSLYFVDAVHELEFPAPYEFEAPVKHRMVDAPSGRHRARVHDLVNHAFVSELEHFYDCVVAGARCRTPALQATKDLAVLRDLYVSSALARPSP